MSLNALLQGAVVAVVVLWAALRAFGIFAPRTRTRLQRALAGRLELSSSSKWLRTVGARLQPPVDAAHGCSSGCSSCDSCGVKPAASAAEKPLQFVPREKMR